MGSNHGVSLCVVVPVLLVFMSCVSGHFVVEKNSIDILYPIELRSKYDGALANFGIPDYGGFIVGSVIYPLNETLGCHPFQGNKPFSSPDFRPSIILLDRGECVFAAKVWYAQEAGAAAVLVADETDETLLTMDSPADSKPYIEKINIPSVLIGKTFGDKLKKALSNKDEDVLLRIDWRELVPHPDQRVEYEFWTNSNDECGVRCDEQINFVKNFKGHAQILEKGGYTLFSPHYITWYCPKAYLNTDQCKSQCINNGRYCEPDPERNFEEGFQGKDVVYENLRQLCVHRVSKERNKPWVWWDYVTDFHVRCSMKDNKYSKDCAEKVMESLDLPMEEIKKCVGDPEADEDNAVLKAEQELQVGRGSRGDVTILPTLVINDVQYRGKLDRTAVLKAICSGFKETTEPAVCLSGDIETNECLERNGGCWQDRSANITACKDTFRGRVCQCPIVNGIVYRGDGYTSCEATGASRCSVNNGGCWSETRNDLKASACLEYKASGCQCPDGFSGDGYNCEDIDECKESNVCGCKGCTCKNTWGSYECKCKGDLLYIKGQDVCIEREGSNSGGFLAVLFIVIVVGAGIACYIFYKYRLRYHMNSEIMSIMSQYMPIDEHNTEVSPETQPLRPSSV